MAVVTGKIDALLYLLGVMAGIFAFGEIFPWIEGFFNARAMGGVTIPELFGLRYGLLVFLVVLMAVGGFVGAEVVERKMARKTAERES